MCNLKSEIGERIRCERKRNHLTQDKMAEKLSISVKHYGAVERGMTGLSIENLVKVSEIFGASLDYLVKGIKDEYRVPERVVEIYSECPDDKKPYLIDMLEVLSKFN